MFICYHTSIDLCINFFFPDGIVCGMARFIMVEKIKDQLLENNKQTYWVPDFVKVSYYFLSVVIFFVVITEKLLCSQ